MDRKASLDHKSRKSVLSESCFIPPPLISSCVSRSPEAKFLNVNSLSNFFSNITISLTFCVLLVTIRTIASSVYSIVVAQLGLFYFV